MNLLSLIARGWRQRPGRTFLSVISVAIAIAAVLGTALAQSSVRSGVRELARAVDRFPSLEIVSAAGGRFPASDAPDLTAIEGVESVVPIVARATTARLRGKRFRTVLVGVPIDNQAAWSALALTVGEPCHEGGSAVLSATVAESLGATVGDRVTVITRRGPRSAMVVGLVNTEALQAFAPAASLVMPLADVQGHFRLGNQLDRLRVLLTSPDERDAVSAVVSRRLPVTLTVQSASSPTATVDSTLRSTELAMRLAGAFSMAMAAFIILNTLRLNFSERRWDFAVVRVLGATRRQLLELHLMEGLALGAIGSLLGVPLGCVLARGLESAMAALLGVEPQPSQVSSRMLLVASALGPVVAALASVVPALQARSVSAHEALGETELRRGERFPRWATSFGVLSWFVAATLVLLVVRERLPPEAAIPAGLLMLVSFIAVIPAVVRPVVRTAAWTLSPWFQTEGRLASEQLLARSTRTGLTVGVLVVALSSGLGLGTAIIDNVNDVRGWYRRALSGDVILTNPSAQDEAFAADSSGDLGAMVAAQPQVERVIEINLLSAKLEGTPAMCVVREFPAEVELPWAMTPPAEAELRSRLSQGELALSSVVAQQLGLAAGDPLRVDVQGRVFSVKIAGLVNDYMLGGRVAYLDKSTAEALFPLGPPHLLIVQAKSQSSLEKLTADLRRSLESEGILVQSFADMRRQLNQLIDGVVGALWGLLAIGFFVGGVAVSNTLTLNVLEQRRELGLLRVIGMTPGQTRRLVFCESLLLGLLGALLGTLGGLTTAIVIHFCNRPVLGRALPFELHGWLVAANVGGCLLIALLAAWKPAAWAARLDVLSAIAHD
jgi:putative ABC transport system permease protein